MVVWLWITARISGNLVVFFLAQPFFGAGYDTGWR
jgi:hypothetical protein